MNEQEEKIAFPHQEVIEYYEIDIDELPRNSRELIQSLEERISKLSSMEDGDEKVNELRDIGKKSNMFAATIIDQNKKTDSEKERKEIENEIKDSVVSIKEEIKRIEQEQEEEEEVPPPSKEGKIQSIINFFENNNSATLNDLKNLGLTNVSADAEEIEIVEDKYKIIKKADDKYILKKKDDGLLGWIVFGAGALIAAFFGYKYLKKNK